MTGRGKHKGPINGAPDFFGSGESSLKMAGHRFLIGSEAVFFTQNAKNLYMTEFTSEPTSVWGLLALMFPVLAAHHVSGRSLPGIEPWEPAKLDDWVWESRSHSETHAVAFVLSMYDDSENWRCGKFNLYQAARYLSDSPDWLPIAVWAMDPPGFMNFLAGDGDPPDYCIEPEAIKANPVLATLTERRKTR